MVHIILLSGGSGMRLWPLSNNARSKQFLKVLRDDNGNHISMVQRVFRQIQSIPFNSDEFDITIATSEAQRFSIESQLPEGGYDLALEPSRRDTAPAIMLACMRLWDFGQAKEHDTVVVMPIDTFADQEYYDKISELKTAICNDEADLVLIGVKPTYPSTKYGYIIPERGDSYAMPVRRFVEKPDEEQAISLIDEGALWNCGVFAFRLGYLMGIVESYTHAKSYDALRVEYDRLPSISFDYEVVERAESVAVISYQGMWKDLGTWNTLTEEMPDSASGRVIGASSTCENVHAVNELSIPMVVSGLKDAVIVATHDGILVSDKAQSSYMKPLVERVAEKRPMYEQRRWGEYRVLDVNSYSDGLCMLVKELVVDSGKQLSYQLHRHRREVWTIAYGMGEVVLDGKARQVCSGDVIEIPTGMKHACRAFGGLHIVEVQIGDLLEEEDIERFGDYWAEEAR